MNFHYTPSYPPIKVLMVNSLSPAAQMTAVKMLSGEVFGKSQLIDLVLLMYSNERQSAEALQMELKTCAFPCMNTIEISSDLPGFSDADVFCFITNFPNPNCIDFNNIDTDEQFDTFYLIIKIANSLSNPQPTVENTLEESGTYKIKNKKSEQKARKPIFIADGLVAIDILKSLSKNIPDDVLFCPTPLTPIAKSTLSEYLKVESNNIINTVHVWAANDEVFHVVIQKPIIVSEQVNYESECDEKVISKELMEYLNLDHTQFNAAWLKKDFIEKILSTATKNPYGCIYKALQITKTLQDIWMTRICPDEAKSYCSMGVISDGSLGTNKGYPYVLPLIFSGDSWSVNKYHEEDIHVKHEIKRINKAVKQHHQKLLPYCKKFLEENVINQAFIPDEESSVFSTSDRSSKPSLDYFVGDRR